MRIRVVTRLLILCPLILGLPAGLIAQGGPGAPRIVEHRVSVVVPVIVSLIPPEPGAPDQVWRIRTNDANLRRRFLEGLPLVRGVAAGTLQITVVPP